MDRVRLLNIAIDNISLAELLKSFNKGVLITPNVDHLIKLQSDRQFYELYKAATYVVLDSKVLFKALKFLGTPVREVIPGSDFFPAFYNYHKDNENIHIFLLGAGPGVGQKAMETINRKVGRDIIRASYSPPYGFENNPSELSKIVKLINESKANVVAVGLGAPKQEKWIFDQMHLMPGVDMYMAIGATIDFEAGNVARAPRFFKQNSLEWLYRLIVEPKRLWKRYLVEDMPIFKLIWKQKRGLYVDPFENQNVASL